MDLKTCKDQYQAALTRWKADNNISWYARIPEKPQFKKGETALEFAQRLASWNKIVSAWKTAPKPEDFGIERPLNEHFDIPIRLALSFGAQHAKLFGFRLYSELRDFQDFLFKQGFRYQYIEKKDKAIEIDIDPNYRFIFSDTSATFSLAVYSSDGVHITQFYFYNDKGYKNEIQRKNTQADVHDFFSRDTRITIKNTNSKKETDNITDYIAPYEAARTESDRFYVVTIEEYKKLPKHKSINIKSGWILFPILALFYIGPAVYSLVTNKDETVVNTILDTEKEIDVVYICTGPQSKSYHFDRNCYGLQNCSGNIEETSLEEVNNMGRKPCRYCYK